MNSRNRTDPIANAVFMACLSMSALPAMALPPLVTVTNMQPVDAAAVPDEDYEPGDSSVFVYTEPVAYPNLPGAGYRATVDLELRNDEAQYIRMDEFASDIGAWSADLTGDELLALPEALLTIPLGPEDHRRPVLTNGGFGVSGLKIEHHFEDGNVLTYGEAIDVLSYDLDAGAGYLVAGSKQFLLGDVPKSSDDAPPSVGQQGVVAKYDTAGFLKAYFPTRHDEVSALADLGDGRYLVAGRYTDDSDGSWLMVSRVRSWELDENLKSKDFDFLKLDFKFGADAEVSATIVPFYDGGQRCEVNRAVGATVLAGGAYYAIAVELSCITGPRAVWRCCKPMEGCCNPSAAAAAKCSLDRRAST